MSTKIRRRTVMLLFAACLCLLLPKDGYAMSRQSLTSPEQAEAFIGLLLEDHAASLDGVYELTPDMEKAVTAAGGWAGLAKSLAALGTLENIGTGYADTWRGLRVLRVPCIFSVSRVDLVFVLENGAIAGLVTDVYTGSAQEDAGETETGESAGNVAENGAGSEAGNEARSEVGNEAGSEVGNEAGNEAGSEAGNVAGSEVESETEEKLFSEVSLQIPVPELGGELPGTLTIPEGEGPFSAVILVHGSGPNNRDEEIMGIKPFKDLAEGLAKRGIAVFRYDKRTYVYGQEMAGDRQITLMDETVLDAAAAAMLISGQEKIDPSRIFVLGHSLGAMAVPAIREQLVKENLTAAGFIMMAPPARPLDTLMREQYTYLYSLLPEITDEQQKAKDVLFEELDRLNDLENLPEDTMIAGAYVPYWKWLRSYDAVTEAEKITERCLILQGEEDYQVTMEDFGLWQEAFGDQPGWTLISYPGLVHTFTGGQKAEGAAAYGRPAHVDEQVIGDIAKFMAAESAKTLSFETDQTFMAGEIILEVISVMIDRSIWIEENGAQNPGCSIDVYYHVRADEKSEEETVSYELSDGRITVGGQEYVLQNVIRSIEDEMSGRIKTADSEGGWRTFCRSFCLMENGPDGKISLPEFTENTPVELQMTLSDRTNDVESSVNIEVNGE